MNNKIGKSAKFLITSDLIYSLTGVFVETFLVAYFLKVTNKNITTISIYYILIYTLTSLGNIVMGKIIKRAPDKSKQIMSFGIVARALFILFIVLLSEKIATNYILIAGVSVLQACCKTHFLRFALLLFAIVCQVFVN